MNNLDLVESKDLREEFIDRVDVLDKVKSLLLLPDVEMATVEQVAEFYESKIETVKSLVKYHKDEFQEDGYSILKSQDLGRLNFNLPKIFRHKGVFEVHFSDGSSKKFPYRGVALFPKRAILRVGMLLRDSEVAKEVRTRLLDIVHDTKRENPEIIENVVHEISEEKQLTMERVEAEMNGDFDKVWVINAKMFDLKNKRIKELENENSNLADKASVLARGNITWSKRKAINYMVRKIGGKVYKGVTGHAWNKIFQEMLYKHSIGIKSRKTKKESREGGKATVFDVLTNSEMELLLKTCLSVCEEKGIDTDDIFYENEEVVKVIEKNENDLVMS